MYRRITRRFGICLAVAAGVARSQAPPAGTVGFEVAAIRAAPPISELIQQMQSGKAKLGKTVEGSRLDIGFVSLADLVGMAYNVKPYQMQGPDWMSQQRFDIQARIPAGVSADKVPEMLQALLADRFKMTMHKEKKDQPVYALIIGKDAGSSSLGLSRSRTRRLPIRRIVATAARRRVYSRLCKTARMAWRCGREPRTRPADPMGSTWK